MHRSLKRTLILISFVSIFVCVYYCLSLSKPSVPIRKGGFSDQFPYAFSSSTIDWHADQKSFLAMIMLGSSQDLVIYLDGKPASASDALASEQIGQKGILYAFRFKTRMAIVIDNAQIDLDFSNNKAQLIGIDGTGIGVKVVYLPNGAVYI